MRSWCELRDLGDNQIYTFPSDEVRGFSATADHAESNNCIDVIMKENGFFTILQEPDFPDGLIIKVMHDLREKYEDSLNNSTLIFNFNDEARLSLEKIMEEYSKGDDNI